MNDLNLNDIDTKVNVIRNKKKNGKIILIKELSLCVLFVLVYDNGYRVFVISNSNNYYCCVYFLCGYL